jgi:hypothetical protein
MPVPPNPRRSTNVILVGLILVSQILMGCGQVDFQGEKVPDQETTGLVQSVEVTFIAHLPGPIESGDELLIEMLDEVTGLALNPSRYKLETTDHSVYRTTLDLPLNSVAKYRYIRIGESTGIEYTSQSRQVRYRLYYATASGEVVDTINRWNNSNFDLPVGRVLGQVIYDGNNSPAAGTLISIAGQQTFTSSDGSFFVDQVPVGVHNLVAYSPDGSHSTFQQGASVSEGSSTPAVIRVSPSKLVEATFKVHPPANSPTGIPIRMVGNTIGLGNSFGDLRGGVNTVANRAPLLTYSEDGSYLIKLQLPAGFDLQYKYSLGDGFWNAELYSDGRPKLRQMIVPDHDFTIDDQIETWNSPGFSPITFTVTTPSDTPGTDQISLQLNPYGWTETIPMWALGEGRWAYILYNPLNIIGETGYRFCRNDQCGIADNAETPGIDGRAPIFKPSADAQLIEVVIKKWMWNGEITAPITVPSYQINPKPDQFATGIELTADYAPSWQPYVAQSFLNLQRIHSEWVVISPTNHWMSSNPPSLAPILGLDPSWQDMIQTIRLAQAAGLKVAVRPTSAFLQPVAIWWQEALTSDGWWQTWFDRYRLFILSACDAAQLTGADALILGDDQLLPAFPGGMVGDQNPVAPADAEQRWVSMISDIRSRYSGKLIWRVTDLSADQMPSFSYQFDGLYVVVNRELSESDSLNPDELEQAWTNYFENDLRIVRDQYDKPVWVGLAYPSVTRAASGCVPSGDSCIPLTIFSQAGLDIPDTTLNLVEQAEIYNAAFRALHQNDWISGIFSVGYYPPVTLQDKSISINGKPAEDVTWFWFEKLKQP